MPLTNDLHLVLTLTLTCLRPRTLTGFSWKKPRDTNAWRCMAQLLLLARKLRAAALYNACCRDMRSVLHNSCPHLSEILKQGNTQLALIANTPFLTEDAAGFPCHPTEWTPTLRLLTLGTEDLDISQFNTAVQVAKDHLNNANKPHVVPRIIAYLYALQSMGLLDSTTSAEFDSRENLIGAKAIILLSLRSRCAALLPHLTYPSRQQIGTFTPTTKAEKTLAHQMLKIIGLPADATANAHLTLEFNIRASIRAQTARCT